MCSSVTLKHFAATLRWSASLWLRVQWSCPCCAPLPLLVTTPVSIAVALSMLGKEFVDEVGSLHLVEALDSSAKHIDGHLVDLVFIEVVLANNFVDQIELVVTDCGPSLGTTVTVSIGPITVPVGGVVAVSITVLAIAIGLVTIVTAAVETDAGSAGIQPTS